jgi:hypothetical protein
VGIGPGGRICLNIFCVEAEWVEALKRSFGEVGLVQLSNGEVGGWSTSFWLTAVRPHDVHWLEPLPAARCSPVSSVEPQDQAICPPGTAVSDTSTA